MTRASSEDTPRARARAAVARRASLSREQMVAAMLASDAAYNGRFIVAMRTTGIYCLPTCRPPRKPKPENVEFYATSAEARAAGFLPCKLCRPNDFLMGYHEGEALVEGLAASLAREPGVYRGIGALAASTA